GTLRSYQLLWMTQSHRFISRTRFVESRASMGTATARSSCCAVTKALALASLRPAIPTRSTPGLESKSGTVDCAIAPYPPRMRIFNGCPRFEEGEASLILSRPSHASRIRAAHRTADPATTSPTLVANAHPYPRNPAAKPPASGPRIDPNPWTALKAPNARARLAF